MTRFLPCISASFRVCGVMGAGIEEVSSTSVGVKLGKPPRECRPNMQGAC